MTRKHYEVIAGILYDFMQMAKDGGVDEDIIFVQKLIMALANAFKDANPKFSYTIFLNKSGYYNV